MKKFYNFINELTSTGNGTRNSPPTYLNIKTSFWKKDKKININIKDVIFNIDVKNGTEKEINDVFTEFSNAVPLPYYIKDYLNENRNIWLIEIYNITIKDFHNIEIDFKIGRKSSDIPVVTILEFLSVGLNGINDLVDEKKKEIERINSENKKRQEQNKKKQYTYSSYDEYSSSYNSKPNKNIEKNESDPTKNAKRKYILLKDTLNGYIRELDRIDNIIKIEPTEENKRQKEIINNVIKNVKDKINNLNKNHQFESKYYLKHFLPI